MSRYTIQYQDATALDGIAECIGTEIGRLDKLENGGIDCGERYGAIYNIIRAIRQAYGRYGLDIDRFDGIINECAHIESHRFDE